MNPEQNYNQGPAPEQNSNYNNQDLTPVQNDNHNNSQEVEIQGATNDNQSALPDNYVNPVNQPMPANQQNPLNNEGVPSNQTMSANQQNTIANQPMSVDQGTAVGQNSINDPNYTLSMVGLVLSILLAPIGLIISIIAMAKSNKNKTKNPLALTGVIIGTFLTVALIVWASFLLVSFVNKKDKPLTSGLSSSTSDTDIEGLDPDKNNKDNEIKKEENGGLNKEDDHLYSGGSVFKNKCWSINIPAGFISLGRDDATGNEACQGALVKSYDGTASSDVNVTRIDIAPLVIESAPEIGLGDFYNKALSNQESVIYKEKIILKNGYKAVKVIVSANDGVADEVIGYYVEVPNPSFTFNGYKVKMYAIGGYNVESVAKALDSVIGSFQLF